MHRLDVSGFVSMLLVLLVERCLITSQKCSAYQVIERLAQIAAL
jgi:hypothetical protein